MLGDDWQGVLETCVRLGKPVWGYHRLPPAEVKNVEVAVG